jgi:hypothetical protein
MLALGNYACDDITHWLVFVGYDSIEEGRFLSNLVVGAILLFK